MIGTFCTILPLSFLSGVAHVGSLLTLNLSSFPLPTESLSPEAIRDAQGHKVPESGSRPPRSRVLGPGPLVVHQAFTHLRRLEL